MLAGIGKNSWAQMPSNISHTDSLKIELALAKDVKALKDSLDKLESEFFTKLDYQFAVETYTINQKMNLQLDYDYSTYGMISSTVEATQAYDKLLNKYYKMLLNSVDEEGKNILKQAQRNWLAYRDAELQLNYLLIDENYSGGGTIQNITAANRKLQITQTRVTDLVDYLRRKRFDK